MKGMFLGINAKILFLSIRELFQFSILFISFLSFRSRFVDQFPAVFANESRETS